MNDELPIFLSAGVPYAHPRRNLDGKTYICDAANVREAIRAVVKAVVPGRRLVFGGQEAITPFVWDMAHSLNAEDSITIYQSKLFANTAPPQARYFKNLVWTDSFLNANPDNESDRNQCLQTLRNEMINRIISHNPLSVLPPYEAAFFIGGMNGIEEEWELFRAKYPTTPVYPIGSTAGAAARLLKHSFSQASQTILWNHGHPNVKELEDELRYSRLFRSLLR